jgi:hypothetical protein
MQTCYNCGKQVPDGTLICPDCGALVKRYDKPAPQADVPLDEPRQPEPAQAPRGRSAVYRDEQGAVRFSGILKAWLIVCAVVAGYQALSYGSILLIYQNQSLYTPFFSAVPDFLTVYQELMQNVGQQYGVYVAILLVSAVKCAGYIWLCAGKRRAALWTTLAACAVLAVLMILFGNIPFAILNILELLATFFFAHQGRELR